ncbi:hypothetical protein [Streptomyces mayteni]
MASQRDRAMQERRRRLRERQEKERVEVRRRQQAQTTALNEIDGAVAKFETARAAVAAAVANAVEMFPSVEALAEVVTFDARDIRALQREHRRVQQEVRRSSPTVEQVPAQACGEATSAAAATT